MMMPIKTIKTQTLAALVNVGPRTPSATNTVINTYLHLRPRVEQASSGRQLHDALAPVIQNLVTAHFAVQLLIGQSASDCHLILDDVGLDHIEAKINQDEFAIANLAKTPAVATVLSDANQAVRAVGLLIDDFADVMLDDQTFYKGDLLRDFLIASCHDLLSRLDAAEFIELNSIDNFTEAQLLVTKQLQNLVLA